MKLKLFEEFKYQEDINEIIAELKNFMMNNSFPRNKWITTDNVKIYVRKSKRLINNQLIDFLDLATIEVYPKGKGILTKLIERIDKEFPNTNIFIESILNDRLYKFLIKIGFTDSGSEYDLNVYKLKE